MSSDNRHGRGRGGGGGAGTSQGWTSSDVARAGRAEREASSRSSSGQWASSGADSWSTGSQEPSWGDWEKVPSSGRDTPARRRSNIWERDISAAPRVLERELTDDSGDDSADIISGRSYSSLQEAAVRQWEDLKQSVSQSAARTPEQEFLAAARKLQVRLVLGVKAELDSTKEAVLRLYRRQGPVAASHVNHGQSFERSSLPVCPRVQPFHTYLCAGHVARVQC